MAFRKGVVMKKGIRCGGLPAIGRRAAAASPVEPDADDMGGGGGGGMPFKKGGTVKGKKGGKGGKC